MPISLCARSLCQHLSEMWILLWRKNAGSKPSDNSPGNLVAQIRLWGEMSVFRNKQLTTECESSWSQCYTRGTNPIITSNQSRSNINYQLSNILSHITTEGTTSTTPPGPRMIICTYHHDHIKGWQLLCEEIPCSNQRGHHSAPGLAPRQKSPAIVTLLKI